MTDMPADRPHSRHEECTDCHAIPFVDNTRTITATKDGQVTETWHTPDCPGYTVTKILMEDGVRRAKERDAWAQDIFPAVRERLLKDAAARAGGDEAAPFVAALTDLVQAMADLAGDGRLLGLSEFAEILQRHFPAGPQRPAGHL
ncbi:hypothetical protein [Streptomyces sp. NBC_00212]|uniref:hypothetical protein n=1 Tax=Streptomyces sp. NBC_00212 TaxID=2975684 RepID=UPI0032524C30